MNRLRNFDNLSEFPDKEEPACVDAIVIVRVITPQLPNLVACLEFQKYSFNSSCTVLYNLKISIISSWMTDTVLCILFGRLAIG